MPWIIYKQDIRGEIAVRIIRACKELDIKTVAIYSDADKSSMHIKMADEALGIGRSPSKESYLNMFKVVEAAKHTGADGIHPGYGFLSENSNFAMLCNASMIKFIGPPDKVIKKMGSKIESRQIMFNQHVPVVPGNKVPIKNDKQALRNAGNIGYPVIIKNRSIDKTVANYIITFYGVYNSIISRNLLMLNGPFN